MGFDYALVHIKYTIPPGILLTLLYSPLLTKLDVYKIGFLVLIAVVATIPWDSYLIRTGVWSYPQDAVLGVTVWRIPVEELFFFIVQTYDVCLLYLCINKPVFEPAHCPHSVIVRGNSLISQYLRLAVGYLGQALLVVSMFVAYRLIQVGGEGTYLGLIVIWSFPFLLLLWSLSHQFLLRLPYGCYVYPIVIPTLYLWVVDTLALQRGTWVIETGTKLGLFVWDGLEVEEALFFLVTNAMIVLGLTGFTYAVAIIDSFPDLFPDAPALPSPMLLIRALLIPLRRYNGDRVVGFNEALLRLQGKSRSFYLASSTFSRRLRIDLILLYSFCRVADDLVDRAATADEVRLWISRLHQFLDLSYDKIEKQSQKRQILIDTEFPADVQRALTLLPTKLLSKQPLYDLLKGFELDLSYSIREADRRHKWPIVSRKELELYGYYVAGTVAELCLDLVFHHTMTPCSESYRKKLKQAGTTMGIALQTINIARDVQVDAAIRRVYIPTDWLQETQLSPEQIIKDPNDPRLSQLRSRLLDLAFECYHEAQPALEELPAEARAPMRVAIESYVEIGRVLRSESYQVKAGRATVPKLRRIRVAWKALLD